MPVGNDDRQLTGCPTHVGKRLVPRGEIKLLRQGAEWAREIAAMAFMNCSSLSGSL